MGAQRWERGSRGSRQNLPVPLGDLAPVHMGRRPPLALARGVGRVAAACGGLCAVAGAVLLVLPTTPSAYAGGGRVTVGAMTLRASGRSGDATLYGGDASYVLGDAAADGSRTAAAAWSSHGATNWGRCRLHREATRLVDECSFAVDGAVLSAVDLLDPATASVWQRTYADGVRVTIIVPRAGSAVPVAFPVGH